MTARLCVAMVTGMLAVSAAAGDDWPQWRGPERTGISKETGLLKTWPQDGPKRLWAVRTPGKGFAAPAVVGETLYITGNEGPTKQPRGALYAIGTDGRLKWKLPYGREWGKSYQMARTSPTIEGERGYLVSGLGKVVCFDAKAGKELWAVETAKRFKGKNITWGIAESPLIVDDKVICHPGGPDAAVAALNKATGETVWTTKGFSEKSAYCSPMLKEMGGRKLIITQTENHIVGIDAADGTVLWKVPQRNKYAVHPNTPVIFNGMVFVSAGYGYGSQLLKLSDDGGEASQVWRERKMDNHFQGMVYVKGRLFGSGLRGNLYCMKPEDGSIVYAVREVRKAAILYAEGRLYAYDERGGKVSLVAVEPDSYTLAGQFRVGEGSGPHWAHPVLAHGVLYIRHGEALMAYDVKAP